MGALTWDPSLGVDASLGGFSRDFDLNLRSWDFSFDNVRLGSFVCAVLFGNFRLGSFVWGLSLRNVRFGDVISELSLSNFEVATFTWKLSLGKFRVAILDSLRNLSFVIVA